MVSQVDRKLRTRKALMDSALALVAEGRHYSSLSLREVSKRAGVVPNAFYRHFKDLDELGLALADEFGLLLRQIMRQARLQGLAADSIISDSVNFYIEHVQKEPELFRFMAQSITGGSPAMREAMRNELGHFAKEMIMDLSRLGILTHISGIDMDMLGHLVIQTVFGTTTEVLDLPASSANMIAAIRERTIKQVRLIFLGANDWDAESEKQKKHEDKANRKKKKPKSA
jgi:AcrR family transcriptional regulator